MTIAAAILLIVAGAILTFAVDVAVQGVNLNIVGWILMIAGGAGLILSLFQDAIWAERAKRREAGAEGRPPERREPREPRV